MKLANGTKYGIYTGLALIAYFLFMKIIGYEERAGLRIFNFVIVIIGVFASQRALFKETKPSYAHGLFRGLRTAFVAIILLIAFLGLYSGFINPDFIRSHQAGNFWGFNMNSIQIAVVVTVEGVSSGFIASFIGMQYFKGWIKRD